MDLIVFGFKNNISEEYAKELNPDAIILDSNISAINDFVSSLEFYSPDKVIGFGMYSGRDNDKLRIETTCKNKFRNQKIGIIDSFELDKLPMEEILNMAMLWEILFAIIFRIRFSN